jgi:hypothetical protein
MRNLILFLPLIIFMLFLASCENDALPINEEIITSYSDDEESTSASQIDANSINTESDNKDTQKDTATIKDSSTGDNDVAIIQPPTTITIMGFSDLDEAVSNEVNEIIDNLDSEYQNLVANIDTYEKYQDNIDKIEAFYAVILEDTRTLCIRMREYSIKYAEAILSSDQSNDDKYEDFDELLDVIYEDASDEILDEIYNGILDEVLDDFYNGALDDKPDGISYDEWYDIRSDEYDWWSDTRSDVYDEWSDLRSDVYDLWSDIRGELWDDDIEKAKDDLIDFIEEVEKLNGNNV